MTVFLKQNPVGSAWANVQGKDLSLGSNTDNNATTTRHGFLPKLSGSETDVLNGAGEWVASANDALVVAWLGL